MKKIIAFVFLALFVFNLIGFKLVYFAMQQNADTQFVILVDNNRFDKRNLVEIKIPNPIPYTKATSNFERVDGEISYTNQVYKYVFRKVSPNFITILCLPDVYKNKITNAEKKFERIVNNIPKDSKNTKQSTSAVKANVSEFDYFGFDFKFINSAIAIKKKLTQHNFNLKLQAQKVAFLPPKNCLSIPIV